MMRYVADADAVYAAADAARIRYLRHATYHARYADITLF